MGNLDLPEHSWIVLDTNFLIDFYSKQSCYVQIVTDLKQRNNSIVSTDLVRCEFIRSKTSDVVVSKSQFFSKLIESLLPIDQETMKLVQPTIQSYGEDVEKASLTDIMLACTVQRYSKVYLLTRNHHDFPTRLFSRSCIFNIELDKDVRTYALYQYRKPDAKNIEAEIEEIPF
jgi:hypothetical protein